MRVLLTGASGFVGSHILDALRAQDIPTVLLLRPASSRRFIAPHLPHVEIRAGALDHAASLQAALEGVTHVIHCAGVTKALRAAEYFVANEAGTRRLVEAINARAGVVQRLVYLSSLAAGGPGTATHPVREADPPRPISAYGQSKLAAERVVRTDCQATHLILRPPGVYGPRDKDFLRLFRAVQRHVAPQFGSPEQELSLVFAPDLARIVVAGLTHPAAAGQTVNVAAPEIMRVGSLAAEIAGQLGVRAVAVRLPLFVLRAACALQTVWSCLTRRPSILGLDKYPELAARGWVCDTRRLREELKLDCPTSLREGLGATLAWYREQRWL